MKTFRTIIVRFKNVGELQEFYKNELNIEFVRASDLIKEVSEQRLQHSEDFNVNSKQDTPKNSVELIGEPFLIQINKKYIV